jgi:hypothetical protein
MWCFLFVGCIEDRVYLKITHYLQRTKRIFEEKLQRLRENSAVVCRKIFVDIPRFVYKLEFRTLRIFHEIRQVELHRKNGL